MCVATGPLSATSGGDDDDDDDDVDYDNGGDSPA